jgi:DNA-binding XRE family transcriptional regulator
LLIINKILFNVLYNRFYFEILQTKRSIMTKFSRANWLPRQLEDNLLIVGEQFRLARLRRNLTIEQVAERAQCSRLTVAKLEKGLPTVSLGVVLRVLYALQLDTDILMLAKDDALGRDIQDIELKNRKRASKKS